MLLSLCCSVVIMLYGYCVALLLFVLSYVLIVCTVPLPPGVNPIAVDKYINKFYKYTVNLLRTNALPSHTKTHILQEVFKISRKPVFDGTSRHS